MRHAFRVRSTFQAEVAMDLDKQAIVADIVAEAEKLDLGSEDVAIFDVHDLGLKVVVRFSRRMIADKIHVAGSCRGALRPSRERAMHAPAKLTGRR